MVWGEVRNIDLPVLTAIKHASGSKLFQLRVQLRPCPWGLPCRGSLMRGVIFFLIWALCLCVSSLSMRKQANRETNIWQYKCT